MVQSFQAFPVGAEPFAFLRAAQPQVWGAEVFRLGLWIALPMMAMLLFVNLVLGVDLARRAADEHLRDRLSDHARRRPGRRAADAAADAAPFTIALERMLEAFR